MACLGRGRRGAARCGQGVPAGRSPRGRQLRRQRMSIYRWQWPHHVCHISCLEVQDAGASCSHRSRGGTKPEPVHTLQGSLREALLPNRDDSPSFVSFAFHHRTHSLEWGTGHPSCRALREGPQG